MRVAVVLAGCGHQDGAEIREASFLLLALDELDAAVQCFAPNVWQQDVVNHLTGETSNEKRHVLVESARIARGNVEDLANFDPLGFDALMFAGGTGGAKNLSNFALAGKDAVVQDDVARAVQAMRDANKPMGFICITPTSVAAPLLATTTLTAGPASKAELIEQFGHNHKACLADETVADQALKIVSTPAYMHDARTKDVYAGIRKMVAETLAMA